MTTLMEYYENTLPPLKTMHTRGFITTEQLESNLHRVFKELSEIVQGGLQVEENNDFNIIKLIQNVMSL